MASSNSTQTLLTPWFRDIACLALIFNFLTIPYWGTEKDTIPLSLIVATGVLCSNGLCVLSGRKGTWTSLVDAFKYLKPGENK